MKKNNMSRQIINLYRRLFAFKKFYKFNRLMFSCSLRGMGILNYENMQLSGEKYLVKKLSRYYKKVHEGCVFDVGANVGNYSLNLLSQIDDVNVYLFEPHPLNYKKLVDNITHKNTCCYNLGLGAKEENTTIYDYADRDGSTHASIYKGVIEEIHKNRSKATTIRINTLDNVIKEKNIKKIVLLKIDTEGNEYSVLEGGINALNKGIIDIIHFEFNEMNIKSRVFFADFKKILKRYNLYRLFKDDLLRIDIENPVFTEIFAYQNIIAIRKDCEKMFFNC